MGNIKKIENAETEDSGITGVHFIKPSVAFYTGQQVPPPLIRFETHAGFVNDEPADPQQILEALEAFISDPVLKPRWPVDCQAGPEASSLDFKIFGIQVFKVWRDGRLEIYGSELFSPIVSNWIFGTDPSKILYS